MHVPAYRAVAQREHRGGQMKGRSAIILYERHPEWKSLTGRDRILWAKLYVAGSVGVN